MRDFLLKFGLPEENIYHLADPSEHATNTVYIELLEKLMRGRKKDPPVNYLMIHVFSANGIQISGMQSLLFNEFDP